jgi:hypothetical protein
MTQGRQNHQSHCLDAEFPKAFLPIWAIIGQFALMIGSD